MFNPSIDLGFPNQTTCKQRKQIKNKNTIKIQNKHLSYHLLENCSRRDLSVLVTVSATSIGHIVTYSLLLSIFKKVVMNS